MVLPSRCAYHVIYDSSLLDSLKYAAENGWSGIVPDFGVPRFSPERYGLAERNNLRTTSLRMGIEWGFHAPGDDVSLFTTYPSIRNGILDYFRQAIDFARDMSESVTNLVVHAGVPPRFRKAGTHHDDFTSDHESLYIELLRENLRELIRYGSPDVEIVLENYRWNPQINRAIDQLIPEGLKLCLDIPKIFTESRELIMLDWEIFQKHRNAISVVHLHDRSSTYASHQVIGKGDLDFSRILSFLSDLDRPLQYVFEVRDRLAAQESLSNFENLLRKLAVSLP